MSSVNCPVCKDRIEMKVTERKSGKPSLMLVCPENAAHFRAFINDEEFVHKTLAGRGSAQT